MISLFFLVSPGPPWPYPRQKRRSLGWQVLFLVSLMFETGFSIAFSEDEEFKISWLYKRRHLAFVPLHWLSTAHPLRNLLWWSSLPHGHPLYRTRLDSLVPLRNPLQINRPTTRRRTNLGLLNLGLHNRKLSNATSETESDLRHVSSARTRNTR